MISHLFSEVVFAEMDNNLFNAILEDLILSTHVKVIQELLFPLCDLVFFVHEVIHVLEVLIQVKLLPEHRRVFHRKGADG